jgi:hypothetical protein
MIQEKSQAQTGIDTMRFGEKIEEKLGVKEKGKKLD